MENRAADYLEDPVAAYDCIAPFFDVVAQQREAYNNAVDALIARSIRQRSRSMLDVGAGDGTRAERIARAAGIDRLWLLEPSTKMRSRAPVHAEVWPIRAESLSEREGVFDVITCLWNVLGHISPAAQRIEVLRQFARLVAPQRPIFIDVQHRYNARQYGLWKTALRCLRDRVRPGETNGDVRVTWQLGKTRCVTAGHVFTAREFTGLCRAAGLKIEQRFVIDYGTGEQRRWTWQGNLLYVLKSA